jgi:hypothetical protein
MDRRTTGVFQQYLPGADYDSLIIVEFAGNSIRQEFGFPDEI